ncbi:RES family NAD+ phosphorylase [Pseudomonas aeruginosa]|nr:RES family NAD+ phosphorylase [Pseudomonas aeruginosa]HCG1348794.1 RES family NAD+ phosphorylase [Pseudomonas aeruginosa]
MVYLSEHPALAMLETLVHLGMDPSEIPDTFNLLRVQVPDEAKIERVQDLPKDWRDQLHDTRKKGDQWMREGVSLLLAVPSATMPFSENYLFNPQHPHADDVELTVEEHELDRRLLRSYLG